MRKAILKAINILGYDVTKVAPKIKDQEFLKIYDECKAYTCTSIERMYSLYNGVVYILKNNILGDFVECGVWHGGSCMLIAKTLLKHNAIDRNIVLFDTFEGMTQPTDNDVDYKGESAQGILNKYYEKFKSNMTKAELSNVENNMKKTGYPSARIFYVKGMVEATLPDYKVNNKIALLRLDTDWYESTKIEMNYLFPSLEKGGVLIIDDYGHWQGARKAIDEYIEEKSVTILLNRIDYTGRIAVKL